MRLAFLFSDLYSFTEPPPFVPVRMRFFEVRYKTSFPVISAFCVCFGRGLSFAKKTYSLPPFTLLFIPLGGVTHLCLGSTQAVLAGICPCNPHSMPFPSTDTRKTPLGFSVLLHLTLSSFQLPFTFRFFCGNENLFWSFLSPQIPCSPRS